MCLRLYKAKLKFCGEDLLLLHLHYKAWSKKILLHKTALSVTDSWSI